MTWVHSFVPSWGWSIVIMTILLKIVTLPFTLAASRSAKRMQKVMPLVTEVREKFKDNPAKQQEAMMRVYKENKVNPLGGCLPVLVTMPFFIGFFSMLQSAADLRFASFLWVKDLAAPDTVVSFGVVALPLLGLTHLTINVLPLILWRDEFLPDAADAHAVDRSDPGDHDENHAAHVHAVSATTSPRRSRSIRR